MSRLVLTTFLSLIPVIAAGQELQLGDPVDLGLGGSAFGQQQGIDVSAEAVVVDASSVDVKVTVTLPPHNYIYSANTPFGIKTAIGIKADGFNLVGAMTPDRKPKRVLDPQINETMEKFYDSVTWTQRLKKKSGSLQPGTTFEGELTGQYCSDDTGMCMQIRPAATFQTALPADLVLPESTTTVSETAEKGNASVTVAPTKMRLPKGLDKPPISFTVSLTPSRPAGGDLVKLSITANVDRPYHVYSITQPKSEFGPQATSLKLSSADGLQEVAKTFAAESNPERKKSELDDSPLEYHHDSVTWSRDFVMVGEAASVAGEIEFQICNESSCLAPEVVEFQVSTDGATPALAPTASSPGDDVAANFGQNGDNGALIPFILSAVSAGFLALLTPCVFPMIPVTVSYFLKQGEERPGSTIKLATIYCAGIVGAFTILGLAMAVLVGPTALNQLANSPWLNLFFAVVFVVFALMLMGMFEITVPSFIVTWTSNQQQSNNAVLGALFMALTFTLVSFTCTFAFVGSILVLAAKGDFLMPIIGMVAFSTAFASPFFLLAMFPAFLSKLPKSGGWMNSIKVTLGLLELAIVTKFLSVADTGFSLDGTPQYLDYHLVMGSWIAIAVITSLYLLKIFRLPGDTDDSSVGPVRCLFSIGFFGLAAYISVGLFSARAPEGALWDQIVAFAPPQIDVSNEGDGYFIEHDGLKYALDFDAAVEVASDENKPMFLDFTGVQCINCRLMEKGVLSSDSVHSVIKDLVRVQLYVDEVPGVKSEPQEHDRLLSRNHTLQEDWFGDVSIPAYVIATPDGKEMLSTFKGLDTTGQEFQKFLSVGLQKWDERSQQLASAQAPDETTEKNDLLAITLDGLDYSLDFDEAQSRARAANQPLFVEFYGVNGLQSRLAEIEFVSTPDVHEAIQDFVRVKAFVDAAPSQLHDQEDGGEKIVSRNRELMSQYLKESFVPSYLVLSPAGEVLAAFPGKPQQHAEFVQFLQEGHSRWEEIKSGSTDSQTVMQASMTE